MKKRMRFLAVAALSLAMTTAFGQQGQSGSQGSSGSSGTYQQGQTDQDRSGVQGQGQSGTQSRQGQTGTQSGSQSGTQSRQGQSGQGSQGQGMGSAEARVRSEVQWMKTEFNLDAEKEQRLHDVLLKYEKQSTTGGDAKKNKDEKEKEIKAIIGEDNYKIYKEKKSDKDKNKSGSSSSKRTGAESSSSTTPQR